MTTTGQWTPPEPVTPAEQINRPIMRGWQLWGRPKNQAPQQLPGEQRGHQIWGTPQNEPAKPADAPAPAPATTSAKGKKGSNQ